MDGGSEVPVVTSHTKAVTCLALPTSALTTPLMATTCQDGVLRIWQMPSQPADWHQVFLWTYLLNQNLHIGANLIVTGFTLHREHACFTGKGVCIAGVDICLIMAVSGKHLVAEYKQWQMPRCVCLGVQVVRAGGCVCVCVFVCGYERETSRTCMTAFVHCTNPVSPLQQYLSPSRLAAAAAAVEQGQSLMHHNPLCILARQQQLTLMHGCESPTACSNDS